MPVLSMMMCIAELWGTSHSQLQPVREYPALPDEAHEVVPDSGGNSLDALALGVTSIKPRPVRLHFPTRHRARMPSHVARPAGWCASLAHAELDDLAIAHLDCDALEKQDGPSSRTTQ